MPKINFGEILSLLFQIFFCSFLSSCSDIPILCTLLLLVFYSSWIFFFFLVSFFSFQFWRFLLRNPKAQRFFPKLYLIYTVCLFSLLSCVQLLQPHGLYPTRLLCPWDFPGKNTGVGCHFLLQGIFPTQGSNPSLLHCSEFFTTQPPGKPLWGFPIQYRPTKSILHLS